MEETVTSLSWWFSVDSTLVELTRRLTQNELVANQQFFLVSEKNSSQGRNRTTDFQTVLKYPLLEDVWRQQPFVLQLEAEGQFGPLFDFKNAVESVLEKLKSGEATPWEMTDSFAPM